jgi:hypothetical protein
VYFASIHDQIRIWTLSESSGQIVWVPKNNIGLEPVANVSSLLGKIRSSPWVLNDTIVLDILPPFQNIRCFRFVKQLYLDIF